MLQQWYGTEEPVWLEERFFRHAGFCAPAQVVARSLFAAEDWINDLMVMFTEAIEEPGGSLAATVPGLLPTSISLHGFIELTALETRLLEMLGTLGVNVRREEPPERHGDIVVYSFETPEDEWQAAALWAKARVGRRRPQAGDRFAVRIHFLGSGVATYSSVAFRRVSS